MGFWPFWFSIFFLFSLYCSRRVECWSSCLFIISGLFWRGLKVFSFLLRGTYFLLFVGPLGGCCGVGSESSSSDWSLFPLHCFLHQGKDCWSYHQQQNCPHCQTQNPPILKWFRHLLWWWMWKHLENIQQVAQTISWLIFSGGLPSLL